MKFLSIFRHPSLTEEVAGSISRLERLTLQQTLQLVEADMARATTQAKLNVLRQWGKAAPAQEPKPELTKTE